MTSQSTGIHGNQRDEPGWTNTQRGITATRDHTQLKSLSWRYTHLFLQVRLVWEQRFTHPVAPPPQVLVPAQTSSQVDQVLLGRALAQLDDTLDKLESMFLRRQPFLCGDDITVADLLAVCELMQVRGCDWMTRGF